jgi:MFS family permease
LYSYTWAAVGLCFVLLFIATGIQIAFGIFLLPMSSDLGWSVSSLTLTVTIGMLSSGLSLPIMGRVIDRYGSRKVILVGTAVSGVSTMLLAFASSLWHVYLLFGVLFGFTWNSSTLLAGTSLVSGWCKKEKNIAMTVFQSGFAMGWLFIVTLTEILILNIGWRSSWLVLGATLSLVVFAEVFLLKEPKRSETNSDQCVNGAGIAFSTAFKTRFFILIGILIQFICGFTDLPFTTLWVPIGLKWGVGEVNASYMLGFMAVLVLLGTIAIGPLPKRYGNKMPLTFFYLIRAVAFAIPVFLVNSVVSYDVFTVLFGISYFGMVPIISAWMGQEFGQRAVGSLLGFSMFMHFLGAGTGIFVFNIIQATSQTFYYAFVLSLVLVFASIIFCLSLKPAKLPFSTKIADGSNPH